jgi:hypothetical protein
MFTQIISRPTDVHLTRLMLRLVKIRSHPIGTTDASFLAESYYTKCILDHVVQSAGEHIRPIASFKMRQKPFLSQVYSAIIFSFLMTLPEIHNTHNIMDMMDQSAYWPTQRTDSLPLGASDIPTTEATESHLQMLYGLVSAMASFGEKKLQSLTSSPAKPRTRVPVR